MPPLYQGDKIRFRAPVQGKGLHVVASAVPASPLAARKAMIDSQLKPSGIVTPRVVGAFYAVAREDFVAPARRALAYVDAGQPLGSGRDLLTPLSLGTLIEEAGVMPDDKVLIIGAATGYSAAVMARLAGQVVALESDAGLVLRAREALAGLANVAVVEGPLEAGWADGAPYTLILIDGAVETLPAELIAQLAEGGRLLTILSGTDRVSRAAKGRKQAGILHLEPFAEAAGPVLPPFRKAKAFHF
jgi:protein-L-isoaspartate(D-aspartate) O-methyltransferase